jgi:epoxyqueuosine reductase
MQSFALQHSELDLEYKIYTDTGPILERELAQSGGIGWIGKNSCLIIPGQGSYYFLAEIFINIEFPFDQPEIHDYCGRCTRCIDKCPTNCINNNRTIDASRCISYLTIENKNTIPQDQRKSIDQWIFGCDICQSVCPWNIKFGKNPSHEFFSPYSNLTNYDLLREENFSLLNFKEEFKRSPILRAKRKGFLRNIIVAMGNTKSAKVIPILLKIYFRENEPLIRELIFWALHQLPLQDVKNFLTDDFDEISSQQGFEDLKRFLIDT